MNSFDLIYFGSGSGRFALSLVFLVAGVAKLFDPAGGRKALLDFGVPVQATPVLAIALPLAELAIAVALIPTSTALSGAIGALALLLVFVVAIGINLVAGRTPDCHCFGQLYSAPAGWSTFTRNAALAFVAAFLVWAGRNGDGPSLLSWLGRLTTYEDVALAGGVLALALLAGQAALLLQLLKQQGRILLQLDALTAWSHHGPAAVQAEAPKQGLPVGSRAAQFSLKGLREELTTLPGLLADGKSLVLLFTNPKCGPCQALLPEVSRWHQEHSGVLSFALVSEGTVADNVAKTAELGLSRVLLQQKREVADAYQAWGTPAAVIVQPDGTIGSPAAVGADAIRALVADRAHSELVAQLAIPSMPQPPYQQGNIAPFVPTAQLGQPAPEIEMKDLDGNLVFLTAFHGRRTLILFWNPGCGFCKQMLNELRDWDANPPLGAPSLVVVSTGSAENARSMELRAPVLLDPSNRAGAAFGANGTPMAVVLDGEGRIASHVAAGAQAVFELSRTRHEAEAA